MDQDKAQQIVMPAIDLDSNFTSLWYCKGSINFDNVNLSKEIHRRQNHVKIHSFSGLRRTAGRVSALCPRVKHLFHCLILVQPRKTGNRPHITVKWLTGT